MYAMTGRSRSGALAISLPMLFFGCLMSLFGYYGLADWQSEQIAMNTCHAVWLIAGPAALGSSLWLWCSLGKSSAALRIGGAAIFTTGAALVTAAATGVMQC